MNDPMRTDHIQYRIGKSRGFRVLTFVLAFACMIPLAAILFFIIKAGITRINFHFLVNIPRPVGEKGGGIANALLGSVIIIALACLIAIPIGMAASWHDWRLVLIVALLAHALALITLTYRKIRDADGQPLPLGTYLAVASLILLSLP